MDPTDTPRGSSLAPASFLFFTSGATALAYEVVWFRRFSQLWGSSSLALACVVGSFLAGLGLGAWAVGKVAARVKRPLVVYGIFELLIGAMAFTIPQALLWLQAAGAGIGDATSSPLPRALVRVAWAVAVLGPPCVLMGGTLPLLVELFASRRGGGARWTGWLYAVNTLGGAGGVVAAGFWLLPALGLARLNEALVAASVLLGCAALAFGFARAPPRRDGVRDGVPAAGAALRGAVEPRPPAGRAAAIALAAFLAGCASLLLEVAWTRQLALVLGSSTYAFSAMLAVFLLGIGGGSLLFHASSRFAAEPARAAAWAIVVLALSTALGKLLLPLLSVTLGLLRPLRASIVVDGAVAMAASAVVELVPALAIGLLFPLLVSMAAGAADRPGRAAGRVYGLNTAGTIIGVTAGSLILLPRAGTAKTLGAALVLYASVLVLLYPARRWREHARLLVLLTLTLAAAFAASREEEPRKTNWGMFLYGPRSRDESDDRVLYFREGSSANVLVTEQNEHISLRVNGKVDASTLDDMQMQLGSAYFPLFLAPEAREVLVVGFGSGTTAGALLLHPEVRVTCCEIEAAVLEASLAFAGVNHQPEKSPRFRPVIDDGRSCLAGADRVYDIVVSEPSNPWMAGVASLFTREFYELVRRRLAPGGLLAQWVQAYRFTISDYALVLRTVLAVFPYAVLVRTSPGDTIVIASTRPIVPDEASSARAQAFVDGSEAAAMDLETYFGSRDVRAVLLKHVLLGGDGLRRLIALDPAGGGGPLHTDEDLRLEFDAPRRLFTEIPTAEGVDARIVAALDAAWIRELASRIGAGQAQAEAVRIVAESLDGRSQRQAFRGMAELGLSLDPGSVELLADRLIACGGDDAAGFDAALLVLEGLPERSATTALARAGAALYRGGAIAQSAVLFEKLAARQPQSATAWANLANARRALGLRAAAVEAIEKADALDPLSELVRESKRGLEAVDAAPK